MTSTQPQNADLRKYFLFFWIIVISCFPMKDTLAETASIAISTHQCGNPNCYWETPMDITDTEAVWTMLMQPITVVDGDQKSFEYIRSEPNENADPIGEVTCASQGVHVIETLDNGWSYIECFSSSFYNSDIQAWNELVEGYIKTDKLITKEVQSEYAMIVDKLTQRLYLFSEGELLDTLMVSTGLPNEQQPYNETRSGDFLIISPMGGFASGNMYCAYGMRFNNGDAMHEVPYLTNADGTKNYSYCEAELGQRASHGCIRVQRLKTPGGINMQWIWDALRDQMGTRLVIWEDVQGRQISYPSEDTLLYYNPDGGQNYHSQDHCNGVRDEYLPLISFSYGEIMEELYANLTPCPYCTPVLQPTEIQRINALYSDSEDTMPVTEDHSVVDDASNVTITIF